MESQYFIPKLQNNDGGGVPNDKGKQNTIVRGLASIIETIKLKKKDAMQIIKEIANN